MQSRVCLTQPFVERGSKLAKVRFFLFSKTCSSPALYKRRLFSYTSFIPTCSTSPEVKLWPVPNEWVTARSPFRNGERLFSVFALLRFDLGSLTFEGGKELRSTTVQDFVRWNPSLPLLPLFTPPSIDWKSIPSPELRRSNRGLQSSTSAHTVSSTDLKPEPGATRLVHLLTRLLGPETLD